MNHCFILRSCCLIAVIILLAGCQARKSSLDNAVDDLIIKGSETFNIMDPYAVIQHDFKRGHIMRARARALAMDKKHPDYAKAQKLLAEKIEPARRRVFVHFLRTAKQLEKNRLWADAMWAYDQAMAVTVKPEVMQQKRIDMMQHLRQLRFESLLKQRRREDRDLFSYALTYDAPKGVNANDEIYARMREEYEDQLESRERQAFRAAQRYLRKKEPEIAYIEIESFLRLNPDSIKGSKLLVSINREMPPFVKVPPVANSAETSMAAPTMMKRATAKQHVTAEQIRASLKAGELVKAKQLAHIYQRSGGKGADALVTETEKLSKQMAARKFAEGSRAFRNEQLDQAIRAWRSAATLAPEKTEYVESLRRARQLQERLKLLQSES